MGTQYLIKYYGETCQKMNQDSDLPAKWRCDNKSMGEGRGGGARGTGAVFN
jgi:hypothetical protein